jgi:fumarylacetoacetate (FAA) hydrolase family protein
VESLSEGFMEIENENGEITVVSGGPTDAEVEAAVQADPAWANLAEYQRARDAEIFEKFVSLSRCIMYAISAADWHQ